MGREAARWYGSLTVEVVRDDPRPATGPVAGVDLGLKCFAMLSAPRRLRHRQRPPTRKRKEPRTRRKSDVGLARRHRRIPCRGQDFLHKATTRWAKTKSVIVGEDLRVRGVIRNRHLSPSIAKAG